LREGLQQLVHRGDALRLRPRLDPALARWLWLFARSCSHGRYEAGLRALAALNRRTLELYDAYRAAGIDFEQHEQGLVVAARSEQALAHYRELGRFQELDPSLEPALDREAIAGALHAPVDRHVEPASLTAGLARSLRDQGVDVRERTQIASLRDVRADAIVVAAGLGSAALLRPCGVRMPLLGGRGYSVTLAGDGTPPRHAVYLAEARLALSPLDEGVRIAGSLELGARASDAPRTTARRLLAAAKAYLAGWRPTGDAELWSGIRPCTADGLPLIGAAPGAPNVFVAAGHAMLGVTLAPATAALLAPLVLHGERAPELAPFDPGR
jgi:D-amino-acid dehydrogenase